RAIPSSQCIVCHVHPGTAFANQYLGYTWWDNETHGQLMYTREQVHPTPAQELASLEKNPEASAIRGLWSDLWPEKTSHAGDRAGPDFLARTADLNPRMHLTKFADFHGHGWLFRAVFKHNRKGRLLDARDEPIANVTPENTQVALETPVEGRPRDGAGIPVHLKDSHLEKGMHCVDCHFEQAVHGNGELSRLSKTIRRDGPTWGDVPASVPDVRMGASDPPAWGTPAPEPTGAPSETLAHRDDDMACYACHTSWLTSCFGCQLPMRANQ